MNDIYVISPSKNLSPMLTKMISAACEGANATIIQEYNNTLNLKNKKFLFVSQLDSLNLDIHMLDFLSCLYEKGKDCLEGSTGALLIHSRSEIGTKSLCREIIFLANNLGCEFIGHPLVEATHTFSNLLTWQKTIDLSLEDICIELCKRLGKRLIDYSPAYFKLPNVTVLYSSPHKTSNTLDLWHMVSKELTAWNITELQIENGEIKDCKGCSYKLCSHYGKQNSCFYGGIMVENILPSIEKSDAVVWLCPNYNDAVSANLTAAINRLTVLYHIMNFYNKCLFGIVVSGNSGSDLVSKQLIGALNVNKGFRLPPYAFLMATANDPGAIFKVENIKELSYNYALNIDNNLRGTK